MHEHEQIFLPKFSAVAKFHIFYLLQMVKRFKFQLKLPCNWRMQSLVGSQTAVMARKSGHSTHQEPVHHLWLLGSQMCELGSRILRCLNSHHRQQEEPKGV